MFEGSITVGGQLSNWRPTVKLEGQLSKMLDHEMGKIINNHISSIQLTNNKCSKRNASL